jgi:phosphate-selective porin OprO/OprP
MCHRFCFAFLIFLSFVSISAAQTTPEMPKIGGRIMYDVAVFDSDDVELNNGGEIRYARLYAKGKFDGEWFYKLQYDFKGRGAEGLKDAYVGYSGVSFLDSIRIGHFTEYGCLDDTTSSKNIMFMSRSLPALAFIPAMRRLGVGVDAHGDAWYAGAGVFGEGAEVDHSEEDGHGVSARYVWIPLSEKRNTVHLGAWSQFRTPRGDDVIRYRARPESHIDSTRLQDTGLISNVNHTVSYGMEAAWIIGSASLQGEYMAAIVDRDGFSTENYDGSYVTASWFLTGESLGYNSKGACLSRVTPLKPLGDKGYGAVSVACRYSTLSLEDHIPGGEMDNVTLGVNWYPSSRVRFMLNYGKVHATKDGDDTDVDIVQARAQIDF